LILVIKTKKLLNIPLFPVNMTLNAAWARYGNFRCKFGKPVSAAAGFSMDFTGFCPKAQKIGLVLLCLNKLKVLIIKNDGRYQVDSAV
jgi:hypothetical protein